MKRIMTFPHNILLAPVCALTLFACSLPVSLSAQIPPGQETVRASLQSSSSGTVLRVLDISQLPPGLQSAPEIGAILDNSNTVYTVTRNSDNTLSIPLPAGRQPDSAGIIELLLNDRQSNSWLVRFNTGDLLNFAEPPLRIEPARQIVLGTGLKLTARFQNEIDTNRYTLTWSASPNSSGPFQNISGQGPQVSWEPVQAGNYFIRIQTRDNQTGADSTFTSSAPQVFVQSPDSIALTTPGDGQIVAGDSVQLQANIPELAKQDIAYTWSFSQSPVGPFQPIAERGARIEWEPPVAGAYYLRLQVPRDNGFDQYTSSRALVTAAAADDLIFTTPNSGEISRGESIELRAELPNREDIERYLWFYGNSPQGPFTAIEGEGERIRWRPDVTGEFYLRVRTLESNGEERSFTSSDVVVSVRDSDAVFELSPDPANLTRGQSVQLSLRVPELQNRQINWSYGFSPQGPFQAISGEGQNVSWTPPLAGAFYLRAQVSGDGRPTATYSSASALVSVTESSNVLRSSASNVNLGSSVALSAQLPTELNNPRFTWSVGPSPVGPWQSVNSFDTETDKASINWYPPQEGSYFVKVDVSSDSNNAIQSFVSPRALVFVSNSQSFFRTTPSPANIGPQGAVEIAGLFIPPPDESLTYIWSYAASPQGPFTAIGASVQSRFNWTQPGVQGNFHIKLDVRSLRSGRAVSFISANPIIFVGESTQSQPRFTP